MKPGTYNYDAKIAAGGQNMALKLSTEIKEEDGGWAITDTMQTPMGPATDSVVLDKSTLTLKKRSVKQGPVAINVAFADNKASGSMSMNGKDQPIDADLGGALFADAAGAHQVIGTLPLATGYSTTFRNFDLQKRKTKVMQLNVTGEEKVTVPAGSFDAYKVEMTSADGGSDKTTVWIAKDTRQPVKVSAVLTQMAGAVLTAELLP